MSTVRVRNFSLLNVEARSFTATTTSQRQALQNAASENVMIVNNTTSVVFVRTGNAAVLADLNAMPILPGEKGVYTVGNTLGNTTHIAFIVETGTASIALLEGAGN